MQAGLLREIFQGGFTFAQGNHGLGAGKDGVAVVALQLDGAVEVVNRLGVIAVHGFQCAFGEPELVVILALGEFPQFCQYALAGFQVGGAGGLEQKFEIQVAIALHQDVDLLQRFVQLAEADQFGGGQAARSGVFGLDVDPENGGIQGGLVGAQVAGDVGCPFDHLGIAGFVGLFQVLAKGDIGAVALAGKFRQQQLVERIPGEGTGWRLLGLGGRRGLFGLGCLG